MLARTVTLPADLHKQSFVGDPIPGGALRIGDSPSLRKASLKVVIGAEDSKSVFVSGPPQTEEGGAVTRVPYNSKYRCLFDER